MQAYQVKPIDHKPEDNIVAREARRQGPHLMESPHRRSKVAGTGERDAAPPLTLTKEEPVKVRS